MGSPAVIGAILLAVACLVALSARWGFRGKGELPDDNELAALLDGLPGGFVARERLVSTDGTSVLAADGQGRLAIVIPHGAHYLARLANGRLFAEESGTSLTIRDGSLALRFEAGDGAPGWRTRIGRARDQS